MWLDKSKKINNKKELAALLFNILKLYGWKFFY